MKKVTLLILLFAFKINAQVSSYTFSTDTGGTISSSGTPLGCQGTYYYSNDNETYTINLPSTFYFNGNLLHQFLRVPMVLLEWENQTLMELPFLIILQPLILLPVSIQI